MPRGVVSVHTPNCLFFSVTLYEDKSKSRSIDKVHNWKKEEGNTQRLLPRFRSFLKRDMRRNVLPRSIEICMETPCLYPSTWAPTWRPEINKNICY